MNGGEVLLVLVKVHRTEARSSPAWSVVVILPTFMKSLSKHMGIFVLEKLPVGKVVSIFSVFYDVDRRI